MEKIKYLVILIVLIALFSCQKKNKPAVFRIGYSDYSFDIAVAYVLKGILDQQPNLNVELYKIPEDSVMFHALLENELDIAISVLLPLTHKDFMEKHAYEILKFDSLCDSMGAYVTVPIYADLEKVADLRNFSSQMKNTILIPDGQNALYEFGKDVIKDYNLTNYQFTETSWDNIITYVEDSLQESSNFAFIGMRPHWIYDKYDIKILEDSRHSLGIFESAHIICNVKFTEKMPTIAGFLRQVNFNLSDIEYLMELNQTLGSEPYENALKWINQNTFRINRWLIDH